MIVIISTWSRSIFRGRYQNVLELREGEGPGQNHPGCFAEVILFFFSFFVLLFILGIDFSIDFLFEHAQLRCTESHLLKIK